MLYIFHLLFHYFHYRHSLMPIITCHITVSTNLFYNFAFWNIYLLTIIVRRTFITNKKNNCS